MTSSSCVNPSLTYMALTARACDHAVSEIEAQPVSPDMTPANGGIHGTAINRREAIRRAAILAGVALSPALVTFVAGAQSAATKTY